MAVPATWDPATRQWSARLEFDEPPTTTGPIDRCGWGTRTLRDVPSGFDDVRLSLHYQRWQTRDKSHRFTSPLPEALVGLNPQGLKITPGLVQFVADVRTRLDIPDLLVTRSFGGNRRVLAEIRRKYGTTESGTRFMQTERFVLARPAQIVQHLAMDEVVLDGEAWTVLSNNDTDASASLGQRVIGLCRGRTVEDLLPFLQEVATWYRDWQPGRPWPHRITSDMWDSFWTAARDSQVFGDRVLFTVDPYHLWKHIDEAWESAHDLCATCCPDDAPCARYEYNREVDLLLHSLWEIGDAKAWHEFRRQWKTLRSRPGTKAWRAPYDRFDRMLRPGPEQFGSRLRMLAQSFAIPQGPKRPNNGRAERLNRHIREALAQLRLASPRRYLHVVMAQLHVPPVEPGLQTVLLHPGLLRCPGCNGPATFPEQPEWTRISTLPRGLTPLVLQYPRQVVCTACGTQSMLLPETCSPELQTWLQDPLQSQMTWSTLANLAGRPVRQVKALRGALMVPESSSPPDVVLYHAFWLSRRVWLLLTTPTGEMVDLSLVELENPVPESDRAYRPNLHAAVARASVDFLRRHEPPSGYDQVQLSAEYPQLSDALQQEWWQGSECREGRLPFTLAPYLGHGLAQRTFKATLEYLRNRRILEEGEVDHARLEALWESDSDRRASQPLWQTLERHHPVVALAIEDATILKGLLRCPVPHPLEPDDTQHPEQRLQAFYARKPGYRPAAPQEEGEQLYRRQWAAWIATEWLIENTVLSPKIASGHQSHVVRTIRDMLRASPNRNVDEQRTRILAVMQAQRGEQKAHAKRRRRRKIVGGQ